MSEMRVFQAAVVAAVLGAVQLPAQYRGVEASYAMWWRGDEASILSLGLVRPVFGPFSYGISAVHLEDADFVVDDRTATGAEFNLGIGRDGSGLFGLVGAEVGMLHTSGGLDAMWSAGLGYDLRLFRSLEIGVEARYRVEDRGVNGFWALQPGFRSGISVGASLGFGRFGGSARPGRVPGTVRAPSSADLREASRLRGAGESAAELAASVVETALDVMGTPYQWGGTDENGFDCSGLIKYAYEAHGIIVPRISRDQARTGERVDPSIGTLRPGDILGFAVETGGRVTHVGLYVGEGKFIHSATGGVKLSSLVATDGNASWWSQRLVAARRVIG